MNMQNSIKSPKSDPSGPLRAVGGQSDQDTTHIESTARCAADTDPAQAIQHVGASIQIVGASIVLQIRQGQRLSDRDDMVWHTSRAFPDVFICSCTEQIMTDPVVTVDGQVYERSFIEEWF